MMNTIITRVMTKEILLLSRLRPRSSSTISLAARRAVSPEVIGQTITPMTAIIPL
jgi:hypothetical protein